MREEDISGGVVPSVLRDWEAVIRDIRLLRIRTHWIKRRLRESWYRFYHFQVE